MQNRDYIRPPVAKIQHDFVDYDRQFCTAFSIFNGYWRHGVMSPTYKGKVSPAQAIQHERHLAHWFWRRIGAA